MLKGHTKIELTDCKTGKKHVTEETNMVTNAVAHLFADNLNGMGLLDYSDLVPIASQCMSGLLLFEKPVEESAERLYAPSDNHCVGYCNTAVNTGTDVKRGSYNLTESEETTDGHKYVWDFNTSQGNGTISALSLTKPNAGIGYMYNGVSGFSRRRYRDFEINSANADILFLLRNSVSVDIENDTITSVTWDSPSGTASIVTLRYPWSGMRLKSNFSVSDIKIIDTYDIYCASVIEGSGNRVAVDGGDGYLYVFKSNTTQTNNINWLKISKSDYSSYTTGTYVFDADVAFKPLNAVKYSINGISALQLQCAVRNGYLYLLKSNDTGLYKVNLEDSTDITFVEFGFKGTYFSQERNGNVSPGTYTVRYEWLPSPIQVFKDYIIGKNFIVDNDDNVIQTTGFTNMMFSDVTRFISYNTYCIGVGAFFSRYEASSSAEKGWLRLSIYTGPYLSTINNLSEPVLKTATQTMKITYTLTETDDQVSQGTLP